MIKIKMKDINANANIAIVIIPISCKNSSTPKILITSGFQNS